MRERLITLACAVGALLLFLAMFVRRDAGFEGRTDIPRPTSAERRGNGYHAALTWLDAEGIRSVSLRTRFDTLQEREDLPERGNLLIVTLPSVTGFRTEEFLPLDRWVRAGNTLLVLAALSDNPDWSFALGGLASSDLNLLTGLEFETVRAREERLRRRTIPPAQRRTEARRRLEKEIEADVDAEASASEVFRAFAEPQRGTLVPNRPHAYFAGVDQAIALSDYPSQAWSVNVPYEGFVLELAHQQETKEGVLWTRPLGAGRIVVSGFGSLFTNRAMGLEDNARLLANIVGATVASDGVVLFDDVHQGLGATYDPAKFYSDSRLYATMGILIGVWLIWVVGSTRLRAPVMRSSAPREADLVRTAGGFLARVLPSAAGARRLVENFFRRVNQRTGMARSDAPWALLERHPRIDPHDLEQLKSWYAAACAGRRVPLSRLHNLILKMDRQVT